MKWLVRAALAVAVLLLVLAGVVAWVVPGIAKREASAQFEQATGRKLSIGEIKIHPFTWDVEIRDLSMSEPGGQGTFASFQSAEARVGLSSLWKGAPVISKVRLTGPTFNVIRTGPNTYNFSDLLKYLMMPVPSIQLNDVAITGGSIDFHDRALPREELHTLRNGELLVPFLTTIPSQASEYGSPRFSAVIDGAPLVVEAKVRGLPKAVEMNAGIDLKGLSLPVYLSYVPAEIPVKVDSGKLAIQGTASYRITEEWGGEAGWDGTVTLSEIQVDEKGGPARIAVGDVVVRSRATSGEKRGLLLEDGSIEIRKVSVPFAGKDGLTIGLFSVQGLKFSQKKNELEVASVLLQDGHARFSRDRKGTFSPQAITDGLQKKMPKAKPATPAPPPMTYRIARVEGKGIDVTFTDASRKELPAFSMTGAHFLVQDLTGPVAGKTPFDFGARWGKDATIAAKGWVVPTPLAADAEVRIQGFDLASMGPYVDDAQVVVAGGRFEAVLAAAVATRNDKLAGTFRGSAAVRGLEVLDRKRGKLLGWDALVIDGIQGNVDPMKVRVARIDLTGLRANLVMDESGNSNLPRDRAAKPADASAGKGKQPAKTKQGGNLEEMKIDEFHLAKGTIDFTDRSVPGPFRAQIRDVDVRLTGMTTEPGKAADLKARLVMPKGALLTITGKAAPLKDPAFADMLLVLDGLDLTTATPYAGTFLGLEIDQGALTVKSRAKVENGNIAAENAIRVDQLTYGKAVKSAKATILPVRMLTDILRNKDGNIVLDLPVAAKTDDEDLVGTVVVQVAKEVVFPPGSPLKDIPFEGCSADLGRDAQDRLRKLGEALQERQAMKIVAVGFADAEKDPQACRARVAAETAAREKAAAAVPASTPGVGQAAATSTAPSTAPAARAAPPTFLALEGEAQLGQLAAVRAEAVRTFLVEQGKVDPARLSARTGDPRTGPRKKGDALSRVEFAPAGE